MSRSKKQPSDTMPPTSGVDEAPKGAATGAQAESPIEDQPTVNLTGNDLSATIRDDALDLGQIQGHAQGSSGGGGEGDGDTTSAGDGGSEDERAGVEQARELSRDHLKGLLEALVFASDKPMKAIELARLASAPVKHVRELLKELELAYAARGIVLAEIAGGWLFRTSVEYAPFVREMSSERPVRLTRAQVETLAIAAYRQPITRPEIDDIRGVDSGATLKLLLERDLLRILGKKDEPGRPLLYGTTNQFLEFFGLKSLKDLPTLKEFTELSDESRLVAEAELGEVLPETVAATAAMPTIAAGADHDTDMTQPPSSEEQGDTITPPAEHDTIAPPPPAPEGEEG